MKIVILTKKVINENAERVYIVHQPGNVRLKIQGIFIITKTEHEIVKEKREND